jgi:hypothetical protein
MPKEIEGRQEWAKIVERAEAGSQPLWNAGRGNPPQLIIWSSYASFMDLNAQSKSTKKIRRRLWRRQ